jgi:hypothetical protein
VVASPLVYGDETIDAGFGATGGLIARGADELGAAIARPRRDRAAGLSRGGPFERLTPIPTGSSVRAVGRAAEEGR